MLSAREYVERIVAFGKHLEPIAFRDTSPQDASWTPFRTLIMPNSHRLMNVVAGAQVRRLRHLDADARASTDALGTPIDMLGFLGQARDEVSHTRVLASFVHSGSGSPFPQLASACGAALERLVHTFDGVPTADLRFAGAVAHDQHVLADRNRVDVVIESGRCTFFLEAKIDAEEREGQLDDYAAELARRPAEYKLLGYLTLHREQKPKTTQSCVHFTFMDVMRAWLPVATSALAGSDDLKRYLKTIALLYGVAAPGRFEQWPLHIQRACLDMFEGVTTVTT